MKYLTLIAGGLLGFLFVAAGVVHFLKLVPMPPIPAGSPSALFMGALGPTGYLDMVKAFEIIGGLLVVVPRTRNYGLLVLGPIVVNILAYQVFIAKDGYFQPPIILITVLSAFLLWSGRTAFARLLN